MHLLKGKIFYFVWTILGVKILYLSCHNDKLHKIKCIPCNTYEINKSLNLFVKEKENTFQKKFFKDLIKKNLPYM